MSWTCGRPDVGCDLGSVLSQVFLGLCRGRARAKGVNVSTQPVWQVRPVQSHKLILGWTPIDGIDRLQYPPMLLRRDQPATVCQSVRGCDCQGSSPSGPHHRQSTSTFGDLVLHSRLIVCFTLSLRLASALPHAPTLPSAFPAAETRHPKLRHPACPAQIASVATVVLEFPLIPASVFRAKATTVQGPGWMWARVGAYFFLGFIACKESKRRLRAGMKLISLNKLSGLYYRAVVHRFPSTVFPYQTIDGGLYMIIASGVWATAAAQVDSNFRTAA